MLLLFILSLLSLSSPLTLSLNQEGLYLLAAKSGLTDPDSALSSWTDQDDSPCHWFGITCDSLTRSVYSVDLSNTNVGGPFPLLLCRLHNLTFLSLSNNFINSSLSVHLTTCRNLHHLDLSQNLLTGPLPDSLPEIVNLKYLDFTGNNFSGEIPASFGRFENLEVLSMVYNLLEGTVPAFLGNISTLKMLNLSYNPFSPGRIPMELGNLMNLEVLWLTQCSLVGEIPDSLGQLSRLTDLDLAMNNLVGSIPSSLTQLTSLIQIELYNNSLTGELPLGFQKLTALRLLDASMNKLTGTIPDELCALELESLNLYENRLVGVLPASIAYSPNLYELRLFGNRLTGKLPESLGKNSPLRWIDLSSNHFTGEIPAGLCEKGELEELLMIYNSFSGQIPESLSTCQSLTRVRLGYNRLSGEVPFGFWGLPHVYLLELVNNSFSGKIGKSIGRASNMSLLILSNNDFSGSLPEEIGLLDKLVDLSASDNKLSGSLPASIVNLRNLNTLDLHCNQFSGELPNGIKSWKKLNELNLAGNEFSDEIPNDIGSLSVLSHLDLSRNSFSGKIPLSLQHLKLNRLNLSNNRLSGEIPPLFAQEVYRNSFLGNPGLCGDLKGPCGSSDAKREGYLWFLWSTFILAGLVLVVGVIWFYLKYRAFKKSRVIEKSKWTSMSFHKLGFSESEILDSLDEDNVIGTGSSGKVYKVILSNGEAVAVKRLWSGSKKNSEEGDLEKCEAQIQDDRFEAEIETLGKIRHKNIVKLWCCCSTKECKLLVYEYMTNGSLSDLLHSSKGKLLDWPTRYKIILDTAEGLSYLHHDCVPAIVHRDVKSSNILLDADFGAKVSDFGVAKAIDPAENKPKSMSIIAGSCGYIAPEYAYTLRVNEKSDIYSFGVVLLELVTGRLPVDPEFGEKDLVKWVCTTIDKKGIDHVLDTKLDSCFKEEICKTLQIGLLCTSPLPINRPSMRRLVKLLQEICGEDKQLHKIDIKDEKLSDLSEV